MKRFTLFFILLLNTIGGIGAWADNDVSFVIVSPRDVVAGQQFSVKYRLNNGRGSGLNAPQIDGMRLLYGPATSTSTSMQIINGQTTSQSTIEYSYTYYAEKAGTYTIPAASINVDGRKLTAEAKTFKVLPADAAPSASNSSTVNIYDRNTQTADKPIGKDDIFVRVLLNKNSVYKNEAVECVIKLYTKYESILNFSASSTPTYEGFLVEDVPVQAELNAIENYNGQNYRTAVLRKYILYPTKEGGLTVTSGSYDVTIRQNQIISNGYFYSAYPVDRDVKLNEYTSKLTVKPLPSPAPPSFTGAVGDFTIKSNLASTSLRTNEAGRLDFTISGRGNIKFLSDPELQFPSQFELYSPNHIVDARVSGNNMTGTVTSEYTFVPQYPGHFEIPGYEFSYFDPTKGKYITLTTEGYSVDVAKGVGSSVTAHDTPGLQANATDIRHIRLGNGDVADSTSFLLDSPLYFIILLMLTAGLIAVIVITRKREKSNADVARQRVNKANKVARKHLAVARRNMDSDNKELFYDSLLKAMWGYLADRLGIQASELARENVAARLSQYNVDEVVINDTISLLDDCEMARYTPDVPELAPKQLINNAESIINRIESIKH